MDIICLLMELYHYAELKLNLKFEIEVLCKSLELDYKHVDPSRTIRNRPSIEDDYMGMSMGGQVMPEGAQGFGDMTLAGLQGLNRGRASTERFAMLDIAAALPDLDTRLIFPPPGSQPATQNRIRHVFLQAAQNAISEIIAPVVERSVTIAAISASQLVTKDFATEVDDGKLREAAHSVVKALSGSLALVTCKEPLRMTITNNIRLLARDLPDQGPPEGLIIMFVNDNIDMICNMVEQAAENASLEEIEAHIEEAVTIRKSHQAIRPNEPFQHPQVSRWSCYISEPYRQASGGLNQEQLAVYEDFARQSRGIPHATGQSQDTGRQIPDVMQEQIPQVPNLPTPAEAPAVPRQTGQTQRMPPAGLQALQNQSHVNGFAETINFPERTQDLLLDLQRVAKGAPEENVR
ncbi:hypothetical protein LTS18_014106, partial [Coniosporium uncinatum]